MNAGIKDRVALIIVVEPRPFGKCHFHERLATAYDLQQAPIRMLSTLTHSNSPTGTVEDTIKLACTLSKRRKCTSKDKLPYKCSVSNAQTRWSVANQAFPTLLPSISGDNGQAANGMFLISDLLHTSSSVASKDCQSQTHWSHTISYFL